MSYYTKFADVETLLTSTTTTVLGSTDVLFGFSYTDLKPHLFTVGQAGAGGTRSGLHPGIIRGAGIWVTTRLPRLFTAAPPTPTINLLTILLLIRLRHRINPPLHPHQRTHLITPRANHRSLKGNRQRATLRALAQRSAFI